MALILRRAERCLSALALVLGSTTQSLAQLPETGPISAVKGQEVHAVPPTVSATKGPGTAKPLPSAAASAPAGNAASLVELAAAKMKQDEAAAPSRRSAIQYLARTKCQYVAEAEAALIAALRTDPNESVRLEAVQALASGCCVTPRTRDALVAAVNGGGRDGFPPETSEVVKAAARQALRTYAAQRLSVPASALPTTAAPKTFSALAKALAAPTDPSSDAVAAASEKGWGGAVKTSSSELQQASHKTLAIADTADATVVTAAERRFAETAGLADPSSTTAPKLFPPLFPNAPWRPRTVRPVPAIHLTPIGMIPAADPSR